MRGKLQRHYECLGKISEGSDFNLRMIGRRKLSEGRVNNCKCSSELCEDEVLDKLMDRNEIAQCLRKIKNNNTGGSDGLVGELLKYYGGEGI